MSAYLYNVVCILTETQVHDLLCSYAKRCPPLFCVLVIAVIVGGDEQWILGLGNSALQLLQQKTLLLKIAWARFTTVIRAQHHPTSVL